MVATPQAQSRQHRLPTAREVLQDDELFAQVFLKILDKDKHLIPLTYNQAQRHFSHRHGARNLVLKSRQLGFSTMIQGRMYRLAVTQPMHGLTLSHSDEATQYLRRIFARFQANMPMQPVMGSQSASLNTFPGVDSEVVIGTAGSRQSGRGGSFSHIHASEVAFWPDAESIIAGAMQAGNPELYLESTPNGAQGLFYELCMRALDGDKDWTFFFFPWWWDAAYREPIDPDDARDTAPWNEDEALLAARHALSPEQINWRRHKQRELRHLFIQEYPEDPYTCFLVSGAGYFGNIAHAYYPGGYPPPDRHAQNVRMVGGLDWGQADDFTALSIVNPQLSPVQQVHLLRLNKLPWRDMRLKIRDVCRQWRVTELWVETNSMGGPNFEELQREFQEGHLQTRLFGFATTAANKGALLANMASALQTGGFWLLDDPVQKHEFGAYQTAQTAQGHWTYGAPKGGHDDTVIANMAAYNGAVGGIFGQVSYGKGPELLQDYRGPS